MKRKDLFGTIVIGFLVFVALSWVIKSGAYSNGTYNGTDIIEPFGLLDIILKPLGTVINYANYAVYVLCIGGLYGVLKATGAYDASVNNLVKKFRNNRRTFLLITVLVFMLLSAITSEALILLILVPYFVSVLSKLGYSKLSTFMATFGAILVGSIGAITGFNTVGYLNYYFSFKLVDNILFRVLLFAGLACLLVYHVVKNESSNDVLARVENNANVKANEVKENIVVKNKVNTTPMLVVMILVVLFSLVAGYNWYYGIGFEGFETFHEAIPQWARNIIGTTSSIGYWTITDTIVLLLIVSIALAWTYRLSFNKAVGAFVEGVKEYLPTAFLFALSNVVIYCVLGASSGNSLFYTIENFALTLGSSANILNGVLASVFGGIFINDFTYFAGYMSSAFQAVFTDSAIYPALSMIMLTIHGLVQLFVPTSFILIIGLSMLEIPYRKYINYVWKFLVEVLGVSALIVALMLI